MALDVGSALPLWAETAGGRGTLINHSENHTFRIDVPDGPPFILRLHRPGYQSNATIESELAWIAALQRETALSLPRVLPGRDGEVIQSVRLNSGSESRFAVLFAFEPGQEPQPQDDLDPLFERLGEIAALCHRQVETWIVPSGFSRPSWNADTILEPGGLWGDWRTAPGVIGTTGETLSILDRKLRLALSAYGTGSDRFGLIHADMRLANILIDGDRLTLIDFDDSGFGWFGYDFAASISFHEADPQVPAWRAAWLRGYRRERAFSVEDESMLDALVMLRRMALLAWIGTHAETPLAQSLVPHFARGTARLAETFLAKS
jgi:Ser/Thr protein kinase RdoA (MazF antagonist)